jgi:hypothetical protein
MWSFKLARDAKVGTRGFLNLESVLEGLRRAVG